MWIAENCENSPKKHPPIPGNTVLRYQKLCLKGFSASKGGRTNNLNSCWLFLGEPDGHRMDTISLPLSRTPADYSKVHVRFFFGYHLQQYLHRKPSQAWWLNVVISSHPRLFNGSRNNCPWVFWCHENAPLEYSTHRFCTCERWDQMSKKLDLSCCWRLKMVGHDWKWGRKKNHGLKMCHPLPAITFFGSTSYTDLREKKKRWIGHLKKPRFWKKTSIHHSHTIHGTGISYLHENPKIPNIHAGTVNI